MTTVTFSSSDYDVDRRADIQAAIDSFGNKGGTIIINGQIGIDGPGIVFPASGGFELKGADIDSGLHRINTPGPLVTINGGHTAVRHIMLNGHRLATTGICLNTAFDGAPKHIESVAFFLMLNEGIYNFDGDNNNVTNCYFLDAGGIAYNSRNNSINSRFSGNFVQGSGGVRLGSVNHQAEGFRAIDNTILPVGGSGWGFDIERSLEIQLSNNVIDQVLNGCVRIRGNSSYVKMTGNWFASGVQGCVNIAENVSKVTIADNTFEGGAAPQLIANAAVLGDIRDLLIHGNIHNNIGSGCQGQLLLKVDGASIYGNHLPGPTGEHSIYWGGGRRGFVRNNIMWRGPTTDGSVSVVDNIIG